MTGLHARFLQLRLQFFLLFTESPSLLLGHTFNFLQLEGNVDQMFQLLEREDIVTDSVFGIVSQLIRPAVFVLSCLVLRQQYELLIVQADPLPP